MSDKSIGEIFMKAHHTVEVFNHIAQLHYIRECMIAKPELFRIGSWDWIEEEIADIELDLLGIKKEEAAGQGDSNLFALNKLTTSIIPSLTHHDKEVQKHA